jgi:hypothetical protein
MDNTVSARPLDKRRKEARPEHIVVGGVTFERNDITAQRYASCLRTIDRGDRDGAPFIFFNGVKYRPKERYDNFVLSRIQEGKPQLRRHKPRHR